MSKELEQRIERLEAIEAIKQLKAHYLNSCDKKAVEDIRQCFVDGDVLIDYGVVGTFHHRDGLIDVFVEQGCHAHIIDCHQGHNPEINIVSEHLATATWSLHFHQINSQAEMISQLFGFYDDEYQKVDGKWKISKSVFRVFSSQVSQLEQQQLHVLFAGKTPPAAPATR